MSDMINTALETGPLSLPDAVDRLDSAYLGHVIVLWSWALKQPHALVQPNHGEVRESHTVRFRSLDGRDREMEVPHLMFTEPVSNAAGALQ